MPRLTPEEREAFLATPGILCRIATLKEDGAPAVTPIWYIYEDGKVFVTPRRESAWLWNLKRDPRVAITIDEEAHPYRKVVIEGVAQLAYDLGHDDEWRDQYRRIARRYVPPEGAEHYIQETIDQPRALIAVPLEGSKVQTWRMPVPGEEYRGIWHDRYYVPGSKMARE
ncbi:MAG: pyridoxamine 5'-phosphate oxidase family protein [Dehalococcoidia bacterium]|nr:pyridoxamine 5'-phosphate oxidase family protein [Dehalococcoidia bacterium]